MPQAHQVVSRQQGWDPEYYLRKASENGPSTYEFFKKVMDSKRIIDQSYSSCLGLLRLIKSYGAVRMENACKRALTGYKFSYIAVKNILDHNMDLIQDLDSKEYRILNTLT
ncbi:hypothetical protein [Dyadobacter alkalitolerans]|uniref:hypothetical protein n=1 Tax=Dyadobacter alkalitolerans TaxID=492736 RepID=UPI0003FA035D|nr:hypothetical protein [Dyadobacter alkalitolerans]